MNNKLVIITDDKSAVCFLCKKKAADVIELGTLDEQSVDV